MNTIFLPHDIRYNVSNKATRMGIHLLYLYPQVDNRYSEIAAHIGAPTHDAEELIQEVLKLMSKLNLPKTFAQANVLESNFMENLDSNAEAAIDD